MKPCFIFYWTSERVVLQMSQFYDLLLLVVQTLSQVSTHPDMTLDVARTKATTNKPTKRVQTAQPSIYELRTVDGKAGI